jgi:hypothetical protein
MGRTAADGTSKPRFRNSHSSQALQQSKKKKQHGCAFVGQVLPQIGTATNSNLKIGLAGDKNSFP